MFSKAVVLTLRLARSCLTKAEMLGKTSNAAFLAMMPVRACSIVGSKAETELRITSPSASERGGETVREGLVSVILS